MCEHKENFLVFSNYILLSVDKNAKFVFKKVGPGGDAHLLQLTATLKKFR